MIYTIILKMHWRDFRILAIVVTKNGILGKYEISNYAAVGRKASRPGIHVVMKTAVEHKQAWVPGREKAPARNDKN